MTPEKVVFRVTPELRDKYGPAGAIEMAVNKVRTAFFESMSDTQDVVVLVEISIEPKLPDAP